MNWLRRRQRPEPLPKPGRRLAMAKEAESAEIVEVALAAAFRDGEDVVGIPQAAA